MARASAPEDRDVRRCGGVGRRHADPGQGGDAVAERNRILRCGRQGPDRGPGAARVVVDDRARKVARRIHDDSPEGSRRHLDRRIAGGDDIRVIPGRAGYRQAIARRDGARLAASVQELDHDALDLNNGIVAVGIGLR